MTSLVDSEVMMMVMMSIMEGAVLLDEFFVLLLEIVVEVGLLMETGSLLQTSKLGFIILQLNINLGTLLLGNRRVSQGHSLQFDHIGLRRPIIQRLDFRLRYIDSSGDSVGDIGMISSSSASDAAAEAASNNTSNNGDEDYKKKKEEKIIK